MKNVKHDIFRYCGIDSKKKYFFAILLRAGARFMFLFRMCNKLSKFNPLGFFFRAWFKILSVRQTVEIPHTVKIGKGLFMGHFQGIIINQSAVIGENCNISQGVTIGSESRGKRKGTPTIGNRVMFGANSVVVGNIHIGDDVLIGPCTFVNFDVPAGAIVLGSPGKIISIGKGSKGYINKILK